MATKKKTIPVTSVTPASKVKAVSKAQQARTRNLVMGIASATPVGRVAKVAATAAKATKAAKAAKSSRQAGDYVVSGRSANRVIPNVGRADAKYRFGKDMDISSNVKIKDAVSPSGKTTRSGGVLQVTRQNDRLANPISRAEAKANARGLRAANKKTNKVGSKADKELRSRTKSVTLNKEETATLNDYYYGEPDMVQVLSRRTPVNEARSVRKFRPTPKKKSAAQLRPKKKK